MAEPDTHAPTGGAPQAPRVHAMDIEALAVDAAAYDAAVAQSPDIDGFCSGHAFVRAAFVGLQPGRTARIYKVGEAGYLAFAERSVALFADPRPRLLWEPLEAMWGLAAPVVGGEPAELAAALVERLLADAPAAALLVCGLRAGSPRLKLVAQALGLTHRVHAGRPTDRQVASLEGGIDAFLSRRSSRFRANIRRALKAAKTRGLVHEHHRPSTVEDVQRLYSRVAAIDDLSWKGVAAEGLRGSGLYPFYDEMLPLLAPAGLLRFHFLVEDGVDVAYLFGGRLGETFRGLQFAFVAGRERESLGNLAQYFAVSSLCDEGVARYDLGTSSEYKLHWGELTDQTTSIIAVPRRGGP